MFMLNQSSRLLIKLTTKIVAATRLVSSLTPLQITQILTANEVSLSKGLPQKIKYIACNQLASNNPIEDRVRVSSIQLPGSREPSIIIGVFDGHGGGTTADLISQRLFDYIALSLHPDPSSIKISSPSSNRRTSHNNSGNNVNGLINDLYSLPPIDTGNTGLLDSWSCLKEFIEDLDTTRTDVATGLKKSFNRCDHDLSMEIQRNLQDPHTPRNVLHYCLSAAVSGCCAIVMIIHNGIGYIASSGDCRAVMGLLHSSDSNSKQLSTTTIELNDEHNCDNISEIRRLASSHPKTEQNTIIRHNRLLGQLMPFRAFGDFNYKWPLETIMACGLTKAYGNNIVPHNYNTPPYLIVEPDVREFPIDNTNGVGINVVKGGHQHYHNNCHVIADAKHQKSIIIASDGLWEQFESSREVVDTIMSQMIQQRDLAKQINLINNNTTLNNIDNNCATHLLRSALKSSPYQESSIDSDELCKLHHARLESFLTLPQTVVRNFRDDISIVVVQLNGNA